MFRHSPPVAVALLGLLGAAGIAYLTAHNMQAEPKHFAAVLRPGVIVALIAAGVYALSNQTQERMGLLLIASGLFACLWMLNGSGNRVLYSVGLVASGLAPVLLTSLMLVHPSGRLHSRGDRLFVAGVGGTLLAGWLALVLMKDQPPLRTPLLQCAPHCLRNAFFAGSPPAPVVSVLHILVLVSWTALICGAPVLLSRRLASTSEPLRRSLLPVQVVASAAALLWVLFLAIDGAGSHPHPAFDALAALTVIAVPLAILAGLSLERAFMGQALASFTTELVQSPDADPEALMAAALGDPSLKIAYQRPGRPTHVDASGAEVTIPTDDPDRAVAWIERRGRRVAVVIHDSSLVEERRFLQAAGAAATMHLERAQLDAHLSATNRELAASRIRLVEAADAERRRIERDLHDGVQQQLIGLRIKLDLVADAVEDEPARGMLFALGRQMDSSIDSLRALAKGIYPSLLTDRGLVAALRSEARRSPVTVSVRATRLGRFAEDTEVAVYFCCVEALQNVVKHAGPGAHAEVHLSQVERELHFEVSDSGGGFDPAHVRPGNGLANMRDRIEALGGTLTVNSNEGVGTSVTGRVAVY